ncbi:MAG: bifunctional hydroxymethylpyrimidine kinase/phosphomethylpyrimidine kinase [Oscillospiraceae bacterium]|nr:bifunctional hydroxymethylpyrimidine kinase/phosphomethylpyrimidine kinase [Oscillospiraceae bacterium]
MKMNKVLSVAGSDSSGGAGIQADIKTISAFNLYAETAVTALTAQNTMGVTDILGTPADFLEKQLTAVFEDIFPDAVKIGMIYSAENAEVIAEALEKYHARNVVTDTVLISTSGRRLVSEDAQKILMERIFPLSDLITPNLPEAEALTGITVRNTEDMKKAAAMLSEQVRGGVLVKGGHLEGKAADLLYYGGKFTFFETDRINSSNTHGTGCTLSSAIACGLARGLSMEESVQNAKDYITRAISAGLDLGKGNGPLYHFV